MTDTFVSTHGGSAREAFDWSEMCDIEIELPPIDIQEKFAAVYVSMLENQRSYERGLEDLKLACIGSIEDLKKNQKKESILPYLTKRNEKNALVKYNDLIGVGNDGFIAPEEAEMSQHFISAIFSIQEILFIILQLLVKVQ